MARPSVPRQVLALVLPLALATAPLGAVAFAQESPVGRVLAAAWLPL